VSKRLIALAHVPAWPTAPARASRRRPASARARRLRPRTAPAHASRHKLATVKAQCPRPLTAPAPARKRPTAPAHVPRQRPAWPLDARPGAAGTRPSARAIPPAPYDPPVSRTDLFVYDHVLKQRKTILSAVGTTLRTARSVGHPSQVISTN
jgi:hypothetical protein